MSELLVFYFVLWIALNLLICWHLRQSNNKNRLPLNLVWRFKFMWIPFLTTFTWNFLSLIVLHKNISILFSSPHFNFIFICFGWICHRCFQKRLKRALIWSALMTSDWIEISISWQFGNNANASFGVRMSKKKTNWLIELV